MPVPYVLLEPSARVALKRGVDQMARLIRVTMGPRARTVAIAPIISTNQAPEVLDDGAIIARRTLGFAQPFEDMGAMIIRQVACKVGDQVGDGSTTAVVIAQSVLDAATRYVAAGGNPMSIRRGVDLALQAALESLQAQSRPITTPDEIAQIASMSARDSRIGALIGEIFDIIGRDGVVIVEDSRGTKIDREYVEGIQWDKGYVSPYLVTDADRMDATLENPQVLVTDRNLSTAEDVLPILNAALQAGETKLFLIAGDITGDALSTLVLNKQRDIITVLAVRAAGYGDRRVKILEDIAIFTGGQMIREDAGETMDNVTLEHFGRARRVWANADFFNVVEGYGDPVAIRKRVLQIKAEIPTITDEYEINKARERLGKLSGGFAILRVGAPTEAEQKEKRAQADDAVCATRAALEEGLVPGGGAALIACQAAVKKLELTGDEAIGARILAEALEGPTRQVLHNAGFDPSPIVADMRQTPNACFDVIAEKMVDTWSAGLIDPLKVVRVALEAGTSAALMALTTDVLVRKQKPEQSTTP